MLFYWGEVVEIMDNNQEQIKKRLSSIIQKTGRSSKDLSDELEIPYTTFVSYAKGISIPKPDAMKKIADYFGTTIGFIMGSEEEKELSLDEIRIMMKTYSSQNADKSRLHFPILQMLEMIEKISEVGESEDLEFFSKFQAEFLGFFFECFNTEEGEKRSHEVTENVAGLHIYYMNKLAQNYLQSKMQ